jgi:hypothetical protein
MTSHCYRKNVGAGVVVVDDDVNGFAVFKV